MVLRVAGQVGRRKCSSKQANMFELILPASIFIVVLSRVNGHQPHLSIYSAVILLHDGCEVYWSDARKVLCDPGTGGVREAQTAFLSLLADTKGFTLLFSLW